jgi:hypothetical protein
VWQRDVGLSLQEFARKEAERCPTDMWVGSVVPDTEGDLLFVLAQRELLPSCSASFRVFVSNPMKPSAEVRVLFVVQGTDRTRAMSPEEMGQHGIACELSTNARRGVMRELNTVLSKVRGLRVCQGHTRFSLLAQNKAEVCHLFLRVARVPSHFNRHDCLHSNETK